MADSPGVTFVGWEPAAADMRRWADELGPLVDRHTLELGHTIARQAADLLPVLTGALAGSVEVLVDEAGWGVGEGDPPAYAGWIEFGGVRGRPVIPEGRYLYPTALDRVDDYEQAAAEVADDSVGRFSWHQQTR